MLCNITGIFGSQKCRCTTTRHQGNNGNSLKNNRFVVSLNNDTQGLIRSALENRGIQIMTFQQLVKLGTVTFGETCRLGHVTCSHF